MCLVQHEHQKFKNGLFKLVGKDTFAAIFIPRIDTVLYSIADKGGVNTHVTVAEKSVPFTWSWGIEKALGGL